MDNEPRCLALIYPSTDYDARIVLAFYSFGFMAEFYHDGFGNIVIEITETAYSKKQFEILRRYLLNSASFAHQEADGNGINFYSMEN
jgi:hypothetical protein